MPYRTVKVKCIESGMCFAQDASRRCNLLTKVYPRGTCPFKKPIATVTKGKEYPFDVGYQEKHK